MMPLCSVESRILVKGVQKFHIYIYIYFSQKIDRLLKLCAYVPQKLCCKRTKRRTSCWDHLHHRRSKPRWTSNSCANTGHRVSVSSVLTLCIYPRLCRQTLEKIHYKLPPNTCMFLQRRKSLYTWPSIKLIILNNWLRAYNILNRPWDCICYLHRSTSQINNANRIRVLCA